jgi:hypothetical protein
VVGIFPKSYGKIFESLFWKSLELTCFLVKHIDT